MNEKTVNTPLGCLRIVASDSALLAIQFEGQHGGYEHAEPGSCTLLDAVDNQLQSYFTGQTRGFDLPLAPAGTVFQQEVWAALAHIPYGELRSYSDIAAKINRPRAVRAVGAANGRNPLPIVIPCHRVIGSDGSLSGFAGGLAAKEMLLSLEGSWPAA
ncbi:MAG: methylated-DNA--[protein]-cysteine S-methyltransferase [Pseudomonadota bacterium]